MYRFKLCLRTLRCWVRFAIQKSPRTLSNKSFINPAFQFNYCERIRYLHSTKFVTSNMGTKAVDLHEIKSWPTEVANSKSLPECTLTKDGAYKSNSVINEKVSLFEGNITHLKIDAIVNAANEKLLGGGGVDGAIHKAAGHQLLNECRGLGGCRTGEAKITKGYNLPSKNVIHTVGPRGEIPEKLADCYRNSLELAKEKGCRSIAFPCISTGIFGYPYKRAAFVALKTVREWLEVNHQSVDKVIFCVFLPDDSKIYHDYMQYFFIME